MRAPSGGVSHEEYVGVLARKDTRVKGIPVSAVQGELSSGDTSGQLSSGASGRP